MPLCFQEEPANNGMGDRLRGLGRFLHDRQAQLCLNIRTNKADTRREAPFNVRPRFESIQTEAVNTFREARSYAQRCCLQVLLVNVSWSKSQ